MIPNPFSVLYASTKSFLSGEQRAASCSHLPLRETGSDAQAGVPACCSLNAQKPRGWNTSPEACCAPPFCSLWRLAGGRGAALRH